MRGTGHYERSRWNETEQSNNSESTSDTLRHQNSARGRPEELIPLNGGGRIRHGQESAPSVSKKERWTSLVAIGASILTVTLCAVALGCFAIGIWKGSGTEKSSWGANIEQQSEPSTDANSVIERQKEYAADFYDSDGRYIQEDYDVQPAFSDFLPGLAGYYGKPLYAFYVNRGQGIASFGFKSKDYPIQEFHSASTAYQSTPLTGFRTFLQGSHHRGNKASSKSTSSFMSESFDAARSRFPGLDEAELAVRPKRYMYIGPNEMQLQEIDSANHVETNVTYFILPEENFGAFVKRTTITYLPDTDKGKRVKSGDTMTLSVLDGLAKIEPAGGKMNALLKNMARTLEAWKGVYSPYNDTVQMPFYRLSTQPSDSASVTVQEAGHWCLSVMEKNVDGTENDEEPFLLPIIHDPSKVFGDDTTLMRPVQLFLNSIDQIIKEQQYGFAKTASAFAAVDGITLRPGESVTISTFFGKTDHILDVPVIARRLLQPGFVQFKVKRAREITKQITSGVETTTANVLFDSHVQQMFLDNSLRGGIPAILGEVDDDAKMRNADEDDRLKVFHLFSRIHGDLERDYNDFEIEPTFFSNGPGNFRDILQNRRSDVFFNPRIGSFNVKTFLSYIQADGYEPLTVEAVVFTIEDFDTCQRIGAAAVGEADGHRAQREALTGILNSGPFRPGQLFLLMEQQGIELIISRQQFIDMVASAAKTYPMAVYTAGFWADHWTYYIDLIQSYLGLYPEWEGRILFDERLPYFFSPAYVEPRDKKFVLSVSFDGKGKHVQQLNATTEDDDEKLFQSQYIKNTTGWYDPSEADWQHDEDGQKFTSSPIEKLFLLATLKFATRDPYGMAIEYEAGKPGWNDANNGLVGMLGSGTPEMYELSVLLRFIKTTLKKYRADLAVPIELYELMESINGALDVMKRDHVETDTVNPRVPKPLFDYWDTVASAREMYRSRTKVTFVGATRTVPYTLLDSTIKGWLSEIDRGMQRALKFGSLGDDDDGSSIIAPTYFSYNVTVWEKTGEVNRNGHSFVRAKEMVVILFPLFLEGPTRMMKTVSSKAEAQEMYGNVKNSGLYDADLRMYTISASLKGASIDMGRDMAFAPGWLENQSVWLHMSYKFYYELLRHEMYDEFFEEMSSGGMLPFMDPKKYGRSLLECSSFIASSAFEDPSVRGRGFLARLSGSTAEFLSMWVLMMIGPKPFYLDRETGQLRMQLVPSLPRWMFSEGNDSVDTAPTVSFKLFSAIDVTYHHHKGDMNLYNIPPSRYVVELHDGSVFHVDGPSIDNVLADKIRRVVFVASIDAYFE